MEYRRGTLILVAVICTAALGQSALAAPQNGRGVVLADDIPVAHTPAGYWKTMPPPVLADCTEPLVDGAIDMRGLWKVVESTANGQPSDNGLGGLQRIEQCGNRVVVTAGGVVHDMRADGTLENGVNDG